MQELAPLRALSEREERFAQHLAVFDDPAAAFLASGESASSDRKSIRQMAYAIKARPHVAARIMALRNDIAALGPQATQAALVQQLTEALEVDVAEIVRLEVVHCASCYSSPHYHAAWPMLAAAVLDAGRIDTPPEPLADGEFDPERPPWPRCGACLGAGRQVVHATATDKLSAPARRLVRGYETHADGSMKKLVLVDQAALRTELHRTVPGFYAPERTLNAHVHLDVKPLKRGMTLEEAAALWETISPTNTDDDAHERVVSDQ
jgi:hypothetical protein